MTTAAKDEAVRSLATVVGFLVCVEVASGVLQGYYTPIYKDIARHLDIHDASVNWFEAAQLVVAALAVPFLARLGDTAYHSALTVNRWFNVVRRSLGYPYWSLSQWLKRYYSPRQAMAPTSDEDPVPENRVRTENE